MTYQERAKKCLEAFDREYIYHDSDLTEESFVDGYMFGCVDQRKMDIEKACKWLEDILEDVPERDWAKDKVNELREAMEE